MSIYVDEVNDYPVEMISPAARKHGTQWCHMAADTMPELFSMARKLGLSPSYMHRAGSGQWAHFDLTPNKRKQAIRMGAIELSNQEFLAKLQNQST